MLEQLIADLRKRCRQAADQIEADGKLLVSITADWKAHSTNLRRTIAELREEIERDGKRLAEADRKIADVSDDRDEKSRLWRTASARVAALEDALRFYADERFWLPEVDGDNVGPLPAHRDAGARARALLANQTPTGKGDDGPNHSPTDTGGAGRPVRDLDGLSRNVDNVNSSPTPGSPSAGAERDIWLHLISDMITWGWAERPADSLKRRVYEFVKTVPASPPQPERTGRGEGVPYEAVQAAINVWDDLRQEDDIFARMRATIAAALPHLPVPTPQETGHD